MLLEQGITTINNKFAYFLMKIKQSIFIYRTYFGRNNPLVIIRANIEKQLKNMLTANKKLKIAKYRVDHLRYRLYQMEELISTNNPYNYQGGSKLNCLR